MQVKGGSTARPGCDVQPRAVALERDRSGGRGGAIALRLFGDGEDSPGLGDAFELVFFAVGEDDAGTGNEIGHDV